MPSPTPPAAPAPEALAPPPGHPRFPLVDGLRAIAALSIVGTHIGAFATVGGAPGDVLARLNAGVAVFFVVSGFLLYRPFVAARLERRPAPGVLRYARRRALRILPGYWVALTVLALAFPHLVRGPFGGDWWAYYGLVQDLRPEWVLSGLVVGWSLAAEAGFYLLLPLYAKAIALVAGSRDRRGQVRVELGLLAVLALASVMARTWMYAHEPHVSFSQMTPGLLLWFCLGMAMAVASVALAGRAPAALPAALRLIATRPGASWAGAAAAFTASVLAGFPRGFEGIYTGPQWLAEHLLFAATGALLVAPAVFGAAPRAVPARVLSHPAVRWLGLVSYGIFLWHVPLAAKLAGAGLPLPAYALVTVAVSVACGAASYYVVERPFLRLKETGRRPSPAPAPAAG